MLLMCVCVLAFSMAKFFASTANVKLKNIRSAVELAIPPNAIAHRATVSFAKDALHHHLRSAAETK